MIKIIDTSMPRIFYGVIIWRINNNYFSEVFKDYIFIDNNPLTLDRGIFSITNESPDTSWIILK